MCYTLFYTCIVGALVCNFASRFMQTKKNTRKWSCWSIRRLLIVDPSENQFLRIRRMSFYRCLNAALSSSPNYWSVKGIRKLCDNLQWFIFPHYRHTRTFRLFRFSILLYRMRLALREFFFDHLCLQNWFQVQKSRIFRSVATFFTFLLEYTKHFQTIFSIDYFFCLFCIFVLIIYELARKILDTWNFVWKNINNFGIDEEM